MKSKPSCSWTQCRDHPTTQSNNPAAASGETAPPLPQPLTTHEDTVPGEGALCLGLGVLTSQSSARAREWGDRWHPASRAQVQVHVPRLPFRSPGCRGGASGLHLFLRLSAHPDPRTGWVTGHPQLPCYLSGGSPPLRGANSTGRLASQGTDMHLHPSCLRGVLRGATRHLGRSSLIREAP